jgi:Secretion system C-terminal sorting domain
MKRLLTPLLFLTCGLLNAQQGAGLVISEILPNPSGTDSPFELIELVATRTINFSTTPYTVVVCNNGTANTAGWVAGGSISYAFEVNTGTVNAGDVVYVGGSSMITTGTVLRSINTGTTNGDGFGNFATSGVVGNGGTNADGVAVFNSAAATLTSSTVPVDAIFYGTGTGTAVVNAGADGYQMPYNEHYAGGKLQASAFLAPDPASAQYLSAAGTFNPTTGTFTTPRVWTLSATQTDLTTGVTLSTAVASPTLTFASTHSFVNESAGTASVSVNVTNPNTFAVSFRITPLPYSTASGADFTSGPIEILVPASTSGAQALSFPIVNDVTAEADEYIAFSITPLYNCTASPTAVHHVYIKDNDTPVPVASNELFLDSISTFQNGASGSNSAEIVAHDPATQRLYIANSIGAKLDIVNFAVPTNPTLITSINISAYGNINSVAVRDSIVALAIENSVNPQDSGKVVFLNYNGVFISQVKVGAMPDMITFNHAGTKVITACEGEPNTTYTNDPDGSVCVVNIAAGPASVTQSNVTFITFTSFNGQEAALRSQGIRIYGVSGIASKDFEPEYVTIADNDSVCWVTLQENNAIAKIDLIGNTVTQLMPLGYKNYMTGPSLLDASDQTSGIALMNAPVYGMYQPDAVSQYTVNNQIYLITANEGDARAYSGLNEESRISGLNLDPVAFPYASQMKQNTFIGRLNATNRLGDTDNDGDIDQIYTYGARSFSIWNGTTGSQVYDSGDQLERITSTHPVYAPLFNMSNGTGTAKNRSDDKGPEPEGTAVGNINGEQYAFLALERIGGAMMFNVSNPASPVYTGYRNHRTVTGGPDRGAEGIVYIPDSLSPNGHALIILANEVSSTLSIMQLTTCAERANVAVTASSLNGCAGDTVTLTASTVANTTYQWYMNGSPVIGATSTSLNVTSAGNYQVAIVNTTNTCAGKTDFTSIQFHSAPVVTASVNNASVCSGTSVALTGSGAATYTWTPGNLSGTTVNVSPATTTTYTVVGLSSFGCADTANVAVNVLARPTVVASSNVSSVCNGNAASLTSSGAATYNWQPINANGASVSVTPSSATTYTVTGTAANGCTNTATVAVSVQATPTVTATAANTTICSGNSTILSGTGATNYTWFPGLITGQTPTVTPSATTTYTLVGIGSNGCSSSATVAITVNASPVVAISGDNEICAGETVTLNVGGADTYFWSHDSSTSVTQILMPSVTTTYSVSGTALNGCTDSAAFVVTVNQNPTVTFAPTQTVFCLSDPILAVNGGNPSNGVYSGSGISNGNFNPSAAGVGTHYVLYTYADANGCSDTAGASLQVDICTGIAAQENILNDVSVYPNPVNDKLQIRTTETMQRLVIYNSLGQTVHVSQPQTVNTEVDMNNFESGVYYVTVYFENESKSVNVIKQ